jgi:hypothetical protein
MQEEPATTIDPSRCPLCAAPNTCAMELERTTGRSQEPCWCTRVSFDPDLLARVPAAAQGKACVCPACAARTTA